MSLIKEGKSKIVFEDELQPDTIVIQAKDIMLTGDGRYSPMPGKADLTTQMSCDCFEYLERKGIRTHFLERVSPSSIRARRLRMMPIECVARRITYGSYLKRHPFTESGKRLDPVVAELFFKDDKKNDPLIDDGETNNLVLHDQSLPFGSGVLGSITPSELLFPNDRPVFEVVRDLKDLTRRVFECLEQQWIKKGAQFVDLKVECGYDASGELRLGDSIDADGWRVWLGGDSSQAIDRQNLYYEKQFTPEKIAETIKRYQRAAAITATFN